MSKPERRLIAQRCTVRGMPCGESHHMARHPDEVVEKVRELHADGMTYAQIERELGVNRRTVQSWCGKSGNPRRTKPYAKIVMKRVRIRQ